MTPQTGPAVVVPAARRAAAATAVALTLGGAGLAGCGVVSAVSKVAHNVASNQATIDAFTGSLKSGETTPFEATYVTTGKAPTTIVYAVSPPEDLAFTETPSASGSTGVPTVRIVVTPAGEYACTPRSASGSGPAWSCQKGKAANAATRNKILSFYSPAHWVAFLDGFALAAGFAGDSVTRSSLTVNGFSMHCVDFRAPGIPGMSTICTTAQGILGYVKVAGDPTSFQLKAYSAAPPASLFELPPGARVTTAHHRAK